VLYQQAAVSRAACRGRRRLEVDMLQTLVIILVLMWLLGMVSSYTLGGFLHVLLVIALILVIVRLATGRSAV
jgi:uncharacterized membrane protein